MKGLPKKIQKKLEDRSAKNALRKLPSINNWVDFSSNDYLGFAVSQSIFENTQDILAEQNIIQNGATGSRLLSGNYDLYDKVETYLADFHDAPSALLFNSGYDANIGFFSAIPQRGDFILYDEFIHASIRDGVQMCNAKSYKFSHNDLNDLQKKLEQLHSKNNDNIQEFEIYVVTESVFSMDGDMPDLQGIVNLCAQYHAHLIVDEAHATGVFGNQGKGIVQHLGLEKNIFARINTFGKAIGCHGAIILGSEELKAYLVNFARSFIYTTGLPPHSVATILSAYQELEHSLAIQKLHNNIAWFNQKLDETGLKQNFIKSDSAIHCCILSGNENVKQIALQIQDKGFDVKPILSPTVPEGKERLRFCLHAYNSEEEISEVLSLLATFVIHN
ncbi:aminotransferase class I/II-fold pyridoxal phosphate-dependent enzyme [Aquimarina algicola]|uniref:Pyridoxal phosphate-dependent aminotransferase family protein n=1 Tax=Aquimarina algicola TaxID=2589995 RepID=A0A504J9K3_9FLAO|nr:pyridoxal phosphate-dependent aminotransferase family protein [Aquimarina algicola]TPN87606.1 pyridoxal phosphate-dependent aminotransferase family protein [Aquimarina algicola]